MERIHGDSSNNSELYRRWIKMKAACYGEYSKEYNSMGARGIKVCDEWVDNYPAFKDFALKHGYKDGLVIDRIDVDKDFEPDNVRFVKPQERYNNRSNSRIYTYNNKSMTLSQWARELKISRQALFSHVKKHGDPKISIAYYKGRLNSKSKVSKNSKTKAKTK